MHLLAAQPGGFTDDEGIIDLNQTPADIVILSAADSSLAALASAADCLPDDFPEIRLANWMQLLKPAAFDLYQDKVLDEAKVVVVSLLGGENYWPYGFQQLQVWAEQDSVKQPRKLILIPGDDTPDDSLFLASNIQAETAQIIWRFLREGGGVNNQQLFLCIAEQFLDKAYSWHQPQVFPRCMIYMPRPFLTDLIASRKKSKLNSHSISLQASYYDWQKRWQENNVNGPVAVMLFYRSHLQSANTDMFDQLVELFENEGINLLPIAIASLKDPESITLVNALLQQSQAKLIINTTGFSSNRVSSPDLSSQPTDFFSPFELKIPILQLILSSSTQQDWQNYSQGLRSRDIAMQVVLPEMDGRIITRAMSFKDEAFYSCKCEISVVRYVLHQERAQFIVEMASQFCKLATKPNQEKRVALILANYPTKDGRIGNGVGLDTPASAINILTGMKLAGYPIESIPETGDELIKQLQEAVTNNLETIDRLPCWQSLSLEMYQTFFSQLPIESQQAVLEQWGEPTQDPKYRNGRLMLAGIRLGETFVGIQPARGFNLDLAANYHSPDLIPPHNYLAFYFWLRHCYQVNAIVHVGKHGNLEWLPGKGTALSNQCWPDIILGPMPHFYPFIVNDPGEGAQAKRRTQAVIIDHLMPPITRAEVYGELAELEGLVDEYYQAMGMDERRENWLKEKIIEQVKSSHVLEELNLTENVESNTDIEVGEFINEETLLNELDTYLCDIKEAQIRHGLHILGALPDTDKLCDTLVALLRLPRGDDEQNQGILHNLVSDLKLTQNGVLFDPLSIEANEWKGDRPSMLAQVDQSVWRTEGDTRERLELLALQLVKDFVLEDGQVKTDKVLHATFPRTAKQLIYAKEIILAALKQSADKEIGSLVNGLAGEFVEPGPSGAPTRGRLDTLPTGRNFFSVDNRAIPSPAAWAIGEISAQAMIERHLQEHGDYPKQIGLSVWGTATMRTGGDDIAQAFALMGIKPIWAQGSHRVIDFEIISCMQLGRPRVDVTLRVSGFFRDAFPNVMRLYDAAVLAIAEFEEPGNGNVIKAHINARVKELVKNNMSYDEAKRQASYRVFGSKPGAYGAGLQGLIDERCWEQSADLAEAYLNWGGYAYGDGNKDGVEAKTAFKDRLGQLEVVVQNQDNREHDILDSDDYYQFQGGMTNAVKEYSGDTPTIYHNDHSNPALPKVRTLKEELNRVIRSRLLNPKWINAMREHGYKGAFEMSASVDYLFAYDATTNLIDDYQYEKVADSLVFNQENQDFLQQHNPHALEEMAERLLEAAQRGLWQAPGEYAEQLQDLLLHIDAQQEGLS
ncbi:cobaltochelatase subunit CobN [Aliikangiella sp. IMCC44359]|uniref:cobaltochelatase subunit CobN n=1 Tax=Aliikangiella sp. IMCC44359 TaxID=3459125 RepID=UPI00403A91DE